jgi:GT2 family glycosyltransferase
MNTPEISASIVIPVYKRADWLSKCMAALQRQEYAGGFETVIIDDGSPNEEEIAAAIEQARSGGLSIVFSRKTNAGPAAARNYGVTLASGEILCFLDDDSVPDPSWLHEMVSSFRLRPEVSVVNGQTRSYDRENPLPLLLEREVYPGKNWATCNIAYRSQAFQALGGFDETFPEPSWEDNDLGLRSRWAGFLHLHNEQAVVYHPHESTLNEYKQKCLLNGRGAAVFSRKYLFSKPLWGIGAPFVMSRRLVFGLFPSVWRKKPNAAYLKFLWSFYSLRGFISRYASGKYGKN